MSDSRCPPFTYRVGQTVFVRTHQLHGEVIACDRTNDGESLACPPVYEVLQSGKARKHA